MVEIFNSTAYVNNGTRWEVKIFDTVAVSGASAELVINDFSFSYNSNISESVTSAISKSNFSVTFNSFNSQLDAFVNLLIDNPEGRFLMQVFKEGTFEWAGIVMHDFGGVTDSDTQDVTISAVDGLGFLKSIKLPENSSTFVLFDYIIEALNELPTVDFWGANDVFLRTKLNWIDTRISAGSDPFTKAGVESVLFKKITEKEGYNGAKVTEIEPQNYYDILENILMPLNCRLMLVGGAWVITQYELLGDADITFFNYKKTGIYINSTNTAITKIVNQTDYYRGGGAFNFLPAAYKVKVNYLSKDSGNLLPPIIELETEYTTRVLTVGTNNYLKISLYINGRFNTPSTATSQNEITLFLKLKIQIGTYYYSNSGWSTTNTDYYELKSNLGSANDGLSSALYTPILAYLINTPDIPATGSAVISLSIDTSKGAGLYASTEITAIDFKVEFVVNNEASADLVKWEAVNDKVYYSEIELKDSLIGTSGMNASSGMIQTLSGASWGYSSLWGTLSGSKDKYFNELLVDTVLSLHRRALILFSGSIGLASGKELTPLNSIKFLLNGIYRTFTPNNIRYSDGQYIGDWVEINSNRTNIIRNQEKIYIPTRSPKDGSIDLYRNIDIVNGNITSTGGTITSSGGEINSGGGIIKTIGGDITTESGSLFTNGGDIDTVTDDPMGGGSALVNKLNTLGAVNMLNLPTAPDELVTGDLYIQDGFIKIVT